AQALLDEYPAGTIPSAVGAGASTDRGVADQPVEKRWNNPAEESEHQQGQHRVRDGTEQVAPQPVDRAGRAAAGTTNEVVTRRGSCWGILCGHEGSSRDRAIGMLTGPPRRRAGCTSS